LLGYNGIFGLLTQGDGCGDTGKQVLEAFPSAG